MSQENDYLIRQDPFKTVSNVIGQNMISPMNPYAHPLSYAINTSILFRRDALINASAYGFSMAGGVGPLGKGAPLGFRSFFGTPPIESPKANWTFGIKNKSQTAKHLNIRRQKLIRGIGSRMLGSPAGMFMGAGFGATRAYERGEDLAGIAQGALTGGIVGQMLFGPGGGIAGALSLFKQGDMASKLRTMVMGEGGYIGAGFGNDSLVRSSITGGPRGRAIAMGAEYTGTSSEALTKILSKHIIHEDDLKIPTHKNFTVLPQEKRAMREYRKINKELNIARKGPFISEDVGIEHWRRSVYNEKINKPIIDRMESRRIIHNAPITVYDTINAYVTNALQHTGINKTMVSDIFGSDFASSLKVRETTARETEFIQSVSRNNALTRMSTRGVASKRATGLVEAKIFGESTEGLKPIMSSMIAARNAAGLIAQKALSSGGMKYMFSEKASQRLMYDIEKAQASFGRVKSAGILEGMSTKAGAGMEAIGTAEKGLKFIDSSSVAGMATMNSMTKLLWWWTIGKGAAKVVGGAVRGAVRATSDIASALHSITRTEFGSGTAFDSEQAGTERSRAMAAISNAGLNARQYLGREASLMAQ